MTAMLTPKQREANRLLGDEASNIMLRGGSRSGKTFLLCRAIIQRAINAPGSRHAIWRFRFNHAKTSIWSDTLPKVAKLCFPNVRINFQKTDFYAELPNGSQIWIGGLDDKERVEKVLGQEYATVYFNESSQIAWGSIETAMSRLAQHIELAPAIAEATGRTHLPLKAYFDCNPPSKLHWSYQLFRQKLRPGTKEALPDPDDYIEMQINPDDNRDNLPPKYFQILDSMSAAKRLRFKEGEWATEVNGALWAIEDRKAHDGKTIPGIDSQRVAAAPDMARVVVAVDPSGTKGDDGGDDIGIVVAGLGVDGRGYVLDDMTCQLSPDGWGRRAIDAYNRHNADRIVAERNFGGAMVEFVIRSAGSDVPFKEVVASRGKIVRAEPVSALYERGRVSHVGELPDLEDQMCLASGTLIETDRGMVPIEKVTTQDRVLTRKGFAPVRWAGYTGDCDQFVEIGAGNCRIRATGTHPIFDSDTGEFVSAANVRPTQRLLVSRRWESTASPWLGEDGGIIGCQADTTDTPRESFSTVLSMRLTKGQFRAVLTSIIRTITPATIRSKTSSQNLGQTTRLLTRLRELLFSAQSPSMVNALFAASELKPAGLNQATIAHINAGCGISGPSSPPLRSSLLFAGNAAKLAKPVESGGSVRANARTITTLRHTRGASEPVYNLSVAEGYPPEFFANGILVHNCNFTANGFVGEGSPDRADALVWALTELMLGEAAIYPIEQSEITVDPFKIPAYFCKGYGFDVGQNRVAAIFGAWDKDNDVLYLYTEHSQGGLATASHVTAIKARGDWMLGAFTPTAPGRTRGDGEQILENYRAAGLHIAPTDNSPEAGVQAVLERLASGRLKVFRDACPNWLAEQSRARRTENGAIESDELLLNATRSLVLSMANIMRTKPVARPRDVGIAAVADTYGGY